MEPNFGDIATICIFIVGGWIAVKNSYNNRFSHIESEQSAMNAKLDQLSEDTKATRDLAQQIASLVAKVDDLHEDVTKHNHVIERTFKLESDMKTAFHRIDELREDQKSGGTK